MLWSTGRWGIGTWAGAGGALTVVNAVAIGTTIVRVTLSVQPQASLRSLQGDALNPWTWAVRRLDDYRQFTIGEIEQHSDLEFDIHTFEEFGDFLTPHSVGSLSLKALNGAVISPPRSVTFAGVLAVVTSTPAQSLATMQRGVRDIANPQSATASATSLLGGVRQISGGDYVNQHGDDLLNKMVLRRLITQPNGFFHLIDWGIGVPEKQTLRPQDIPTLQKSMAQKFMSEQGVIGAKVTITIQAAQGIVFYTIALKSQATGQWSNFNLKQLPNGSIVQL